MIAVDYPDLPETGGKVFSALMCSILLLAVIAWVLSVNSLDRRSFEKELVEELADDAERRSSA